MALAANTIITQSSTAAYTPAAKTRDNTSTDQTSAFDDVLAQQETTTTGNSVQAPAQGADKAKASKNTQISNKSGNISDDKASTDAIATADASLGTKMRAGRTADKAKAATTDGKSASDAVNDNEYGNDSDLARQMPLAPPPATPSAPQPSTAGEASTLNAIGDATNGAKPATMGANDTNDTEATEGTDEAQAADEAQPADGAPTTGKAQSPSAFQKMLGATKAATVKDSQTAKATPDKDIKTAEANVDSTSTGTDGASDVKPAAPANTGMTNAASTTALVDKTASATVAVTTQSHTTPNLNSLAVEITAKAQSGTKQFDIRLDPPELGRVEVRLSIDAAGKAQAHLSADQPQTLELLQKDAPALTRALRDAGLDVSQSGLSFSLKNQQQNSGGNNSASQSNYDGAVTSSTNVVLETNSGGSAYTGSAGLLDIKI